MRLAVIPARGGSKRIPRKNIRIFGGVPIIEWSIRAALKSQCFDRVIVSTDDEEIAGVARACHAEVPFIRPRELSDDNAGITPVIAHAIEWYKSIGESVSEACCIFATAPFLLSSDLRRGQKALESSDADYAFSVTSYAFPIQRAMRILGNCRVQMFQPENFNVRSQDLEEAWHDAGQFYWGRAEAWLNHKLLFCESAVPVILPRYRVQDIDSLEDWERAQLMFNCWDKREVEHEI